MMVNFGNVTTNSQMATFFRGLEEFFNDVYPQHSDIRYHRYGVSTLDGVIIGFTLANPADENLHEGWRFNRTFLTKGL